MCVWVMYARRMEYDLPGISGDAVQNRLPDTTLGQADGRVIRQEAIVQIPSKSVGNG
jgi:hypothetical protein